MNTQSDSFVFRNTVFVWIALISGALLLVPFVEMQFTEEVNWTLPDFLVFGALTFTIASVAVIALRWVPRDSWTVLGILFAALYLYLWAELAVGLFFDAGS